MKRFFFLVLALLWGNVFAQPQLEILPLKSRTPEQVYPILLPLLEPGAVLTAANGQLFLRASQSNRDDIKRVLAAIDVPQRQLRLRISQSRRVVEADYGGVVDARVRVGRNAHAPLEAQARVWDTRSQIEDEGSQMVQTVDGGRAFIQVGQAFPLRLRQMNARPSGVQTTDAVVYREVGQGFYVQPRLAGDRVTLEISLQAETSARPGVGNLNVQRLVTTVSGRLGEWIEVGGSGRQVSQREAGTLNRSTRDLDDTRSLWLKVEELK